MGRERKGSESAREGKEKKERDAHNRGKLKRKMTGKER